MNVQQAIQISYQEEFEQFIGSQIVNLIAQERARSNDLGREQELKIAIDFCKKFLSENNEIKGENKSPEENEEQKTKNDERNREEVMAKLVELKLELEQYRESVGLNPSVELVSRLKGHEFVLQSSSGRNPYCETCLGTIWRLAQYWRRCKVCGYRTHQKCLDKIRRLCPNLEISKLNFSLQFQLCPEKTLRDQNYQCVECRTSISYGDDIEKQPRLCDYTGHFYCKHCHWNDEMIIPARLVRNWDIEKRPVSRASKQLLTTIARRPLINLEKENPLLFKFVQPLAKMQKLRTNIMFIKCYFVSCKVARKMRILQHLNHYQHFVETDTMYSLDDLIKLINGKLLADIETIVGLFTAHITEQCEICHGNAFFCELCSDNERIFPFSENVAICKGCFAVYHRPCFDRSSRRCPRCARRRARKKAILKEEEEG